MSKNQLSLVFISLLMCIGVLYTKGYAYNEIEKQRLTVAITGDNDIKKSIHAFIINEVSNISDLELEDNKSQWVIDIVILKKSVKESIVSVTVLERLRNEMIIQNTNVQFREIVEGITTGAYYYEDHWVMVASDNNLMKVAEDIIEKFNSKFAEKRRKSYREIRRFMAPSKPELGA